MVNRGEDKRHTIPVGTDAYAHGKKTKGTKGEERKKKQKIIKQREKKKHLDVTLSCKRLSASQGALIYFLLS